MKKMQILCLAAVLFVGAVIVPASFAAEIAKLDRPVRWIVVHRKPRYADEIAAEIAALGRPDVELVEPGRIYEL